MITIINYGLGNINAIKRVYNNLNIPVKIASEPHELENSEKFILPGVGAFDYAMTKFNESRIRDLLSMLVIEEGKYILGICVGMHMMARSSKEGDLPGLGWLDADIKKFDNDINGETLTIPHMGWNNIAPLKSVPILQGLDQDSYFYFLHSYYLETDFQEMVIARTNYGLDFCCAVNHENIFGVQFHPEKSHGHGVNLLKNFADL